jgi:hypothetical protein
MKSPPRMGPSAEATAYMTPVEVINTGRKRSGTECVIMIIAPDIMPAPPKPAMAHPTMRTVLAGATLHVRDLSSNTLMAEINMYVMEKFE